MSIHDEADLKGIVTAAQVAKHILGALMAAAVPGTTTRDLERLCRTEFRALGAESAPQKFYRAPCLAFYSVNEHVVHGLPDHRLLKRGDLLKIDVTPWYQGYVADTARSLVVGAEGSPTAHSLVRCVEDAFSSSLEFCHPGRPVSGLGARIQNTAKRYGFHILKELSGHGVGRAIHEDFDVPNWPDPRQTDVLTEGQVIAVEPMICDRRTALFEKADGWTLTTGRGTLTAHHEDTVLVTREGPRVLTA